MIGFCLELCISRTNLRRPWTAFGRKNDCEIQAGDEGEGKGKEERKLAVCEGIFISCAKEQNGENKGLEGGVGCWKLE